MFVTNLIERLEIFLRSKFGAALNFGDLILKDGEKTGRYRSCGLLLKNIRKKHKCAGLEELRLQKNDKISNQNLGTALNIIMCNFELKKKAMSLKE